MAFYLVFTKHWREIIISKTGLFHFSYCFSCVPNRPSTDQFIPSAAMRLIGLPIGPIKQLIEFLLILFAICHLDFFTTIAALFALGQTNVLI